MGAIRPDLVLAVGRAASHLRLPGRRERDGRSRARAAWRAKADIRWVTSDGELASESAWPLLHLALFTYSRAASPKRHRPRAELLVRRGGVFLGRSGAHLAARIPNKLDLEEITSLLRDGGWVARDLGVRSIEVDPDRLSGRPTIRGRRLGSRRSRNSQKQPWARRRCAMTTRSKREIEDARRWWQAVEAVKAA